MAFKIPQLWKRKKTHVGSGESFQWRDVTDVQYLANGSYGTVFTGKFLGEKIVVKKLEGVMNSDDEEKSFKKEAAILKALKHENIVSFKGFCNDPLTIMLEFVSFDFGMFGADKVVSSLSEFLCFVDRTADFVGFESFPAHIVLDVAKGLQYLHAQKVVHRDLKPGNVLVSNAHYSLIIDDNLKKERLEEMPIISKLTDFGESRSNLIQTQTLVQTHTSRIERGTPVYMAPEIRHPPSCNLRVTNDDLMKADVWSFGMTLFNIINPDLKAPYGKEVCKSSRDWTSILESLLRNKRKPQQSTKYQRLRQAEWKLLENVFEKCTTFDASCRPSADEVVQMLTSKHTNEPSEKTMSSKSMEPTYKIAESEGNISVQLSVRQATALAKYDENICQGLNPEWPANDGTNACSFLSLCIAVELFEWHYQEAGTESSFTDCLTAKVEHIIVNAPYRFNSERHVEQMYDVSEAFSILCKCGVVRQDSFTLTEEMVHQCSYMSTTGKKQLHNCVEKLQSSVENTAALFTCGELILTLVHMDGKIIVIDTHPVPKIAGGNGNGLILIYETTTPENLCQWIWKRMGSSGAQPTCLQSFMVLSKRVCEQKHLSEDLNHPTENHLSNVDQKGLEEEEVHDKERPITQPKDQEWNLSSEYTNHTCDRLAGKPPSHSQDELTASQGLGIKKATPSCDREGSETSKPISSVYEFRKESYSTAELIDILVHDKQTSLICTSVPAPPLIDGVPQSCSFKVDQTILKDSIDSSNCGAWKVQGTALRYYYAVIDSSSKMFETASMVSLTESNTPVVKTRVGRSYYDRYVNSQDVFAVKRYYAINKSNANYKRVVTAVKPFHANEWLDHLLIHYFWEGEAEPIQIKPHGNAKHLTRPYIRTQQSILHNMKTALEENRSYSEVYRNTYEAAGGMNSKDASAEPRDRQQLYNINRAKTSVGGREKYCNDWLSEVISQQQQHLGSTNRFVRNIKLGENGPMGVNFIDQQVKDIERFCTVRGNCCIFSVDTTYNLGDFYVTNTAYHNLSLMNPKTGKHPVFMGPCVVHFNRDEEPFYFLGSELKLASSHLENIQFIGTDDERNIFEGLRKGLGGDPTNVLCTNHFKDNIRRKLRDFSFPDQNAKEIMYDIFGKHEGPLFNKGLIDAVSEYDFQCKLDVLIAKWNAVESQCTKNDPPKFAGYFIKHKATPMMQKMITPIREQAGLGCPPTYYNQNSVESVNFLSKQSVDWKRNKWVIFNEKQYEIVHRQYEESRKAVFDAGEFTLSSEFEHFRVPPNIWRCKTPAQRASHLKDFFSYKPKVSPAFEKVQCIQSQRESNYATGVKLAVPPSSVKGVCVSAATLNGIWEKAERLLNSKNSIMAVPGGNVPNGRMVANKLIGKNSLQDPGEKRKGSSESPTVFVVYEDGKMHCECTFFASTKLCAHAVAVAHELGKLTDYIQWLGKRKRQANLAALYKEKVPKNSGKKPKQRSRAKKNNVNMELTKERTPLPQMEFSQIYHNDNPFHLAFLTGKKKRICATCKVDFPSKFVAIPFDICLVHEERYLYPNEEGKWVPTVSRTRKAYYHVDLKTCILPRHPYFNLNLLKINEEVKTSLKHGHLAVLEREFGYEL